MIETKTITAAQETLKLTASRPCPDCQSMMAEVDRVKENGFSFVWYECTGTGCDAQWLEKKAD